MKTKLLILLLFSLVISCSSTKKHTTTKIKSSTKTKTPKADKIVRNAYQFLGTKYKYGGTTKKGMDCSGLVYTSFKQEAILLPHSSKAMSLLGKTIPLRQVKKGDLLFFKTGRKNTINHVGLVTKVNKNEIIFIHSSTKRGVITSSINEKYYKTRFSKAKRIL